MILKRTQRIVFCGMFTLAVLLTFGPVKSALAQTPTPTPTPTEEELKLQEEKRLLELQRDIELAKKAIRDAQPTPPEPKATPLEGNTTLNDVRIETSMVAYKAMSHVANSIAKEVSSRVSTAKNLLIYDPQVVRDWRFHQALFPAFKGQTEDMKNQYFDLVCKDPNVSQFFLKTYCTDRVTNLRMQTGNEATRARTALAGVEAAIGAGETLIKSFIDLAALFRTETKIEGVAVTIDQSAFVAELSRALKNQFCRPDGQCFHINVYNPAAFNPRIRESETIFLVGHLFVFKAEADRIIKIRTAGKPALVNQLNDLVGQKSETEAELERVRALTAIINNLDAALAREQVPHFRRKLWEERAKAQVELSTLGSEADLLKMLNNQNAGIKQLKAQIKALDDAVKALTDLNERFQAFVDQFIKVDEKGSSALALFIKSEDIDSIVHSGESYWLEVKPILGGGNNRTRKNLIWFFAGARVDHSGGVIAEYALYELTGAIISSDKIAYYNGYVEPKKIMKDRLKDPVR